jgi:1-acyl-sn-glycerol-3-phosphate acyltransferase
MVPPLFVRRLVFAPLVVAIALAMAVATPLLLLLGLILSHGRRRFLRIAAVAVSWFALESVALFASLALWITSGFGGLASRKASYEERNYALCGWFVAHMYGVARRSLGLVVEIQEPLDASSDRPVIVLSRHAGAGDSFLIVHFLLNVYGRRPRIVLKAALQFDPGLDVLLNRLPNAFVPGGPGVPGQTVTEIGRLAAGLDERGAMLIFPEGGNFTPRRRIRAIRRLRRRGHPAEAERARGMRNVMAPHTAGTLAAIEAAPTADIVFVAHTGVDDLMSVKDVWRRIPMEQSLRARWWRVPHEEIPLEDGERWLFDWWERIDAWIAENRPDTQAAPPPP